jgi:hypothetical protein
MNGKESSRAIEERYGEDIAKYFIEHADKYSLQAIEERYGADIACCFAHLNIEKTETGLKLKKSFSSHAKKDSSEKGTYDDTFKRILQEYAKKEAADLKKSFSSGAKNSNKEVHADLMKKHMPELAELAEKIGAELFETYVKAYKSPETASREAICDALHIIPDMASALWKINYKMLYNVDI